MYTIPYSKLQASKPENVKRLASWLGIETSDTTNSELVELVWQHISMPIPKTEVQKQEYVSLWESF